MIDSAEPYHFSDGVIMDIVKVQGSQYVMTLTADEEFLTNPSTVYPVIIDPTVTMTGQSNTYDTRVQSAFPTANYCNSDQFRTGWDTSTGIIRSYISFKSLPNINGGMITNATIKMYEFSGNTTSAYTDMYRVAGPWTSSTFNWSNKPDYTGSSFGRHVVNHAGWYEWNITSLASGWYNGSIPYYGVLIRDRDENARFRRYHSSDGSSSYKPVLTVTYSYKPATPIVTVHSSGINLSKGYANLSWGAVSGASKYKVGIFNGKDYEWFETTSTSWSTQGKGIWPTPAEIQSGVYTLHHDGYGQDLANDPNPVYVNAHGGYETAHHYWFRVIAVNSSGQQSDQSSATTPTLPDSTSPNMPSSPIISVSNGSLNSGNSATINASWGASSDLPSFSNSGIKLYSVQLYVNNTLNETKTTTASSISFTSKPDNASVYIKVRAEDYNGNYSDWKLSSTASTADRTAPTAPAPGSVIVEPGSWTNDETPKVSWSGITDEGNNLYKVQYKIDSGLWEDTGKDTASGSAYIDLASYSQGQHTIYIRGIDFAGNTGGANSNIYYKDTVSPSASITYPTNNDEVDGIVNIKGFASDVNLNNWKLEYGAGESPSSYLILAQGITDKPNEILHSWDVSSFTEQSRYTLKLTATDQAGNTKVSSLVLTKSLDAQNTPSDITITSPTQGQEITQDNSPVQYNNNLQNIEKLFINHKLIDTETTPSEGLTIPSIDYEEESVNEIIIKSTDSSGNSSYSVGSHNKTIYANTFTSTSGLLLSNVVKSSNDSMKLNGSATEGNVAIASSDIISLGGKLSTIKLIESSTIPSGTQITYQVKLGTNDWINIQPNEKIDVETITNGYIIEGQVNIRSVLSTNNVSVSPEINNWQLEVDYIDDGQTFMVKLVEEPTNLTAFPKVNYKTLLRWDSVYGATDNVLYNIYRDTTESFVPSEENKIASGITDKYWYDSNLNYGQTFYYKVTVQKEVSGQTRESVASSSAFATIVDEDELDKRLGLQNYWGYSSFSTGGGTGYIESSQGNMVYQATDTVVSSPYLAMVMRRTYNSQATSKTPMGYGWDFGFNTVLLREFDSSTGEEVGMILKDGDGTLHQFKLYDHDGDPETPDVYNAPKGIHMTLTLENGKYKILRSDNIQYIFNQSLQIESFSEPNGNELTFVYNSDKGYLETVLNNYGDDINLTYYDNDLLEKITLPNDKVISYTYTDENRLKEVSRVIEGNEEYHEKYYYDSGKIVKIEDPKQCKHNENLLNLINKWYTLVTYDALEKVSKVTYANDEYHSFTYSPTGLVVKRGRTGTSEEVKGASFTFDTNGLITKRTDQLDHDINYTYDNHYNVISMSYQNQVNGSLQTITANYTYDSKGNILTITDPLGNVTEYNNYNNFNKPGQVKVPKTGSTKVAINYIYDETRGNILTEEDPSERQVTYTYDYSDDEVGTEKGLVTRITDEYGNTTKYRYDSKGRVIKVIDAKGNIYEVKNYDTMGNPILIEDMKNNQTSYQYDLLGRNTKITYADGNYESYTYDLNSNIIRYKDRRGYETTYEYDALDRIVSATQSNGDTTTISYTYDGSNNLVITTTDEENRSSVEYHDAAGRVVKVEQGGTFVRYEYDNAGNQIKIIDEDGKEVKASYDKLGRQTDVTINPSSDNITSSFTYDLMGNKLSATDGEGNTTNYTYDNINRLLQVQQQADSTTLTTTYEYDKVSGSNIFNKTIYPNGNQSEVHFDELGRTVKEVNKGNPGDSTNMQKQYQYDANGNMIKEIKNDGTEIDYQYNNLNQLVKAIYEKNGTTPINYTDYTYDANGNRTEMIDKKVQDSVTNILTQTSYSYDEINRMTQQAQDGQGTDFSYDGSGNVTQISYFKEGEKTEIQYIHDTNNLLTSINVKEPTWSSAKTISEYTYTGSSKVDKVKDYRQYDTGGTAYLLTDYTYNTLGQIGKIEHKDSSNLSQIKSSFTYQYDDRGYIIEEDINNIYPEVDVNTSKAYTYDTIGRLKKVDNTDNTTSTLTTTSYTYDKLGNRLTMVEGSDNYTYHYNQFNQLTSVDKNGIVGNSTYQYDSRGNQTKEISKETISGQTVNTTKTHTYNKADGLVRTNVAQEGVVESLNVYNTYNGDGQRVKKITGLNDTTEGVATKYYYVGLNLLFTTDDNGNKATENILDPGGNIIASKRFDGNYDNMYFFYQYDVRGSVNNIIQPDGTLVKGYNYDEFGNQKQTGDQNFKNEVTFTGAVSDSGSGLYYMNARHYDPGTGRFLSQDTYSGNAYEPMTQHLYSYTGNNPVNYVDPTGHAYIVGETRNGQVGTIAHPSNPKRIINYRKDYKVPYKSSGSKIKEPEVKRYRTEKKVHSGGFGHRDDNYYVGNLGTNNSNVYLTSGEVEGNIEISDEHIGIDGELGISALDIEYKSNKINTFGIEAEVLTGSANVGFALGNKGIGFTGELFAAGATGEVSYKTKIFSRTVTLTGQGYAGAAGIGADLIYTKKEGFSLGFRFSALYGAGARINVN